MITKLKLVNGRVVVIEQSMFAIKARYEGEDESKSHAITTEKYMALVCNGTPVGDIQ